MKRLLYLITVFALLCGCEKNQEQLEQDQEQDAPVTELGELPDRIQVSTAGDEDDAETRTILENSKVLWQNGDAISYFASNIHNTRYVYGGEDGKTSVDLDKDEEAVGAVGDILLNSQAVYPYNKDITVDYKDGRNIINLTYPTTQKYGVNSFGRDANIMVAAGEGNVDAKLQFRNACGYLVIKLWGIATNGNPTNIKSITLSSVSGLDKIAGKASVIADKQEAPIITMADDASTSVTLDCDPEGRGVNLGVDKENATEFWFCLPPVTFNGGIKITVTDAYGNAYTKQTTKPISIERNKVQPMEALQFETNAPAATKLWYTRSDGSKTPLTFYDGKTNPFNAQIKTHKWDDSVNKIVIEFYAPLTTIQKEAFRKTKIGTIVLPEGVTTIEEGAFEASTLTEISFPGSMTNIGVNAFYDCEDIKTVTFLPSPTKTPLKICNMDYSAVYGPFYDSRLTTINLNRELAYVDEDGDPYTASEDDEGLFYHEHYEEVGEVTVVLGPQVEHLRYRMFNYLPIKNLTIPGTVKSIENNVFEGCDKLTTLTFEPNMEGASLSMGFYDASDDDGPFYSCPLTTVDLNREISYDFGGSTINDVYEGLFGGKPTLVSVTIGEQVKTLSPYMFADSSIKELVIPGNVKTIGNNVFEGCEKLTTLTFEPNMEGTPLTMGFYDANGDTGPFYDSPLTTLNLNREISYNFGGSTIDDVYEGLFGGKSTLVNVTLGEQVKTLSLYMFAGSSIKELVIPGTVKTIENDVFRGCSSLKTITFEPSPTAEKLTIGFDTNNVDESLFVDCPLVSVSIDRELYYTLEGIDVNYKGLFGYKTSLTSVTIGDQLKTLSPYMFAGNGVKSLNLNKVETIANNALADLAVTSLTIPGTVTTIGESVFSGCSKLATITFEPNSSGKELAIGNDSGAGPFVDCPLTTLNLNREMKASIPGFDASGLFGAKKDLTKVTLGEQVKTLPPYMFAGSGITSLNLNKVETIGDRALARLALTSLTIPGNVMTIGNNVFEGCSKLTEVIFQPHSDGKALKIGFYDTTDADGPFYDCPLATVKLNRELDYTFPISDLNDPGEGVFGNRTKLINLTIGEQVKTLSPYMFAGSSITSLDLINVKTIGKYALMGADFTSLTIPASVTTIDNFAFVDCESLANLTFADGADDLTIGFQPGSNQHGPFYQSPLTKITLNRSLVLSEAYASACDSSNEGLFSTKHGSQNTTISLGGRVAKIPEFMFGCLPLTEIFIPATVTEIGNDAFADCTKLSSIVFEEGSAPLVIGYNTVGDDDGPFVDSPLTSVVLNREISYDFGGSTIDDVYEGLFGGKTSLTSVILGNTIKTISPYMFANSNITELDLNNVETIGEGALMGADFTDLTIPASVTTIGNYAFANCESLKNLTFEENTKELTIGFQPGTNEHGPFYQSPLEKVVVNRGIVFTEEYFSACDSSNEGIFATTHGSQRTSVSLGGLVTSIPKYMFSELPIEKLTIPATVNSIGENAFKDCEALTEITFEADSKPLKVFAQAYKDGRRGPFYQSPLSKIYIGRDIEYLNRGGNPFEVNGSEFGFFANNKDVASCEVTLDPMYGPQTITPYMFSGLKMESMTIPAYVKEIGNNAFELCSELSTITFEQSATPLTMGYYDGFGMIGGDAGPFYSCPLTTVNLYREINYTFGGATIDDAAEGLFGDKEELANVTLGDYVKTFSPYMFAGSSITSLDLNNVETIGKYALMGADFTDLTIPASVTTIDNFAFVDCESLANLTFADGADDLTIGFQPGSEECGPFYQSPLSYINLNRQLVMDEEYTTNCDQWDEGVFSNKYYDDGDWTAKVILGDKVETILPYMFATVRMEQLHLPETVDYIGKYVVDKCPILNAIVFYDDKVRPVVADNAFGDADVLDDYNYFLFLPRWTLNISANETSVYYTHNDDQNTYWQDLSMVMTDVGHDYIHSPLVLNNREYWKRYYDAENDCTKPGYEWYTARYFNNEIITPPTE